MKDVKVLGSGCSRCTTTAEMVKKAADRLGVQVKLEKVEDIRDIMKFGVMTTPALVVNGAVKAAGTVLTSDAVKDLLRP